jgi:two-component system chemotaxis response regulator CheY
MVTHTDVNVLVVDDSILTRRLNRIYLKRMGITSVVEASDVNSALKELKKEDFDLILSDWNMLGMSGLSFLKAVKSNQKSKNIPFVMVTAEGLEGSIAEAFEAGVSSYILKPYSYETFKKKVESVLFET